MMLHSSATLIISAMSPATTKSDIIYPCPLSKGYGIPSHEAWAMLKVFLIYRLLLGSTLLLLVYFPLQFSPLDYLNPQLFKISSLAYVVLTLLGGVGAFTRIIPYTPQAQLLIFTDIIVITFILHACGGIASGIGMLLVISITFGGILIGGHCAMLFAAIATLAILTEQTYALRTHAFQTISYSEAGMLGAAFFTTALLAYVLAQRSEQSQLIAQQHKLTILKLEKLNHAIIQHLQTGIIITDKEQHIQMANQAALRLLDRIATPPAHLRDISVVLTAAFERWKNNVEQNIMLLPLPDQVQIHCRFTLLPTHQEMLHMLTLEDNALYNQRLQESKLASLGRLTASIAHEIRNPLGAISHAAQLLAECPTLTEQDLRLTQIIQNHSLRMNGIIEDILQLSRRKTSQRQKIAVNQWVQDYCHNFQRVQHLHADQLTLKLSPQALYALIDPDHLQQIMDNLCLNAFKHNQSLNPHLTINIEQTTQGICLNLIDNGTIINVKNAEHLFEPFFTTSTTGTGLGLYISKELAELNQATLSYHTLPQTPTHEQLNNFRLCLNDAEQPTMDL